MIAQNLRKWGSVEAKEAKEAKEQKGMISDSRLSDMLVYIKRQMVKFHIIIKVI